MTFSRDVTQYPMCYVNNYSKIILHTCGLFGTLKLITFGKSKYN